MQSSVTPSGSFQNKKALRDFINMELNLRKSFDEDNTGTPNTDWVTKFIDIIKICAEINKEVADRLGALNKIFQPIPGFLPQELTDRLNSHYLGIFDDDYITFQQAKEMRHNSEINGVLQTIVDVAYSESVYQLSPEAEQNVNQKINNTYKAVNQLDEKFRIAYRKVNDGRDIFRDLMSSTIKASDYAIRNKITETNENKSMMFHVDCIATRVTEIMTTGHDEVGEIIGHLKANQGELTSFANEVKSAKKIRAKR